MTTLTPNYMTEKLKISDELTSQLNSHDLEMTLIRRLMWKNGWDWPNPYGSSDEYDMAAEDVRWFIKQLLELAGRVA